MTLDDVVKIIESRKKFWFYVIKKKHYGSEVEDIYQDALEHLLKSYKPDVHGDVNRWFGMLINQAQRRARLRQHYDASMVDLLLALHPEYADDAFTLEARSTIDKAHEVVQDNIDKLPYQIFDMATFQGMSYREIAKSLGKTRHNIEVQVHKVRKELSERMKNLEECC